MCYLTGGVDMELNNQISFHRIINAGEATNLGRFNSGALCANCPAQGTIGPQHPPPYYP